MSNPRQMKYPVKPEDLVRNANNFDYHQPHCPTQGERYDEVRLMLRAVADELLARCPPSRELSLALTKLEEAMFWANASIARNEKPQ